MTTLYRRQTFPGTPKRGAKTCEFFKVYGRKSLQSPRAIGAEMESNNSVIAVVSPASDKTRCHRSVNQSDDRVMTKK